MAVKDRLVTLYYQIKSLSVRRFLENIGRWFSYFGVTNRIYDFDYTSTLAVERHQIMRVRDSITHYHNHLNADRDIERLNLALRLLDIIEEDCCAEYHGIEMEFNYYGTIWMDNKGYYTMPLYVNIRNARRFSGMDPCYYTAPKTGDLYKSHLRVEKAWHIYHRLRLYFMRSWWD